MKHQKIASGCYCFSPLGLCLGTIATLFLINPDLARGQIIPDSSLGNESSRITPTSINGIPTERIDGGAIRRGNLFHSFSEFNIEAGKGAYFTNPNGIDNIFSRVTGSNISQINGTLGVLGNANLFFINPNGIVFGPNARLDLRGSFVGTTAESVLFDQGIEWGTTNPQAAPLLTVNIPIGLQFRSNPGTIEVQSTSGLEVNTGQTLALLGGNIHLNGGKLNATGGSIQMGAYEGDLLSAPVLAPGMNIRLSNGATIFNNSTDVNSPGNITDAGYSGNINIRANSLVEIINSFVQTDTKNSGNGGDITITTRRLELSDGAYVATSTYGTGAGGNVTVDASEAVTLIGEGQDVFAQTIESKLFNNTLSITDRVAGLFTGTQGPGNAGTISVITPNLLLNNGAVIFGPTFGSGTGGRINIRASEIESVSGGISSSSHYLTVASTGNTGEIEIETGRLILREGARLANTTFTPGNGGNLVVKASEFVELAATPAGSVVGTGMFSNSIGSTGNSGNIIIETPSLRLRDGARISVTSGFDTGNGEIGIGGKGGNIVIRADMVELTGVSADGNFQSSLSSATFTGGDGGQVSIETGSLFLGAGAEISANALGGGNAGNIDINARDLVQVSGRDAVGLKPTVIQSDTRGAGRGGNISIDTRRLEVSDRAFISTSTFGSGAGGSINVRASESVELLGIGYGEFAEKVIQNFFNRTISLEDRITGIYTGTEGTGYAGNINVDTNQLLVRNGSILYTPTLASGIGGNIYIRAGETVEVNASGIGASVLAEGTGGSINIDTPQLILGQGSLVASSTVGDGNAGNIFVRASELVEIDSTPVGGPVGTGIYSNTIGGVGAAGNIIVTTPYLLMRDGAQISTATGLNNDDGIIPFGGKGGNLVVTGAERVELNGISADGRFRTSLNSGTLSNADAGAVQIEADTLILRDGAEISGSTTGPGLGGSITVRSRDLQLLGISPDGKYRSALSVRAEATGNGGSLDLETARLLVAGGALVEVSTYGDGNAGSLNAIVTDSTEIQGASAIGRSGLFASAVGGGTGSGGNLTLRTEELRIRDGATIAASNFHSRDLLPPGNGPAGNITITANSIRLDNGASLSVRAASGDKGNINLTARDIIAVGNSRINTDATGMATGGNIAVNAENLVAVDNSDISANAQQSFGGRVLVSAGGVFGTRFRPQQTQRSDITASSDLGAEFSGTVEINTPAADPSSGLVTLPENFVDLASVLGADACAQGSSSSFVVTGRGGLPPNPTAALGSDARASSWIDVPNYEPFRRAEALPQTSSGAEAQLQTFGGPKPNYEPPEIVLARGWVLNDKGEVVLTSYDPRGHSPQRRPQIARGCR
ncbi:MAG TPA: filamentous hemagglutinin N-terminal domain-containing protein [Oscillatoriaceae cyanobacterium M33_DOE_052]|uniref:Filamentous hemagglutinin N-terminal domain-containing protein n=1 Tax=Planktothricoides sp. SpSt-374 TaxID=2282167 RepID=A0A7C3ZK50_9CYAN|nr:filamentous hemagglutinin N-terminal domain-containing protein [Oscillatoriaceae cyanobacterium M33_DOE_052]